jgi:hypothetical protein
MTLVLMIVALVCCLVVLMAVEVLPCALRPV